MPLHGQNHLSYLTTIVLQQHNPEKAIDTSDSRFSAQRQFVQHCIKGNNDRSIPFQRVLNNKHLQGLEFANFSANNGWGEA